MKKIEGMKLAVMNVIWKAGEPVTATNISEINPYLKRSTIRKALEELLRDEMIKVVGSVLVKKTYARMYAPAISKEEYEHIFPFPLTSEFSKIWAAMLDSENISIETLNELKEIIEKKRLEIEKDTI